VVIPTYGRPQFLRDTLASLNSQTYPPAEVIVVDDCSPEPVVAAQERAFTPIVLRHLRNQGPGAARNTGAAHAVGDWLLFLDDDDLITPHRLQWAVDQMGDSRAHVAAVEAFLADGRTTQPRPRTYSGDMRRTLGHARPPFLGQVVFRREDLLPFDPTLRVSEDTEWWLRMSDRAVFSWSPDVGLRYRCHPESRHGLGDDTRLRARQQVARRHAASVDRTTRAELYGNVAAEALLARRRAPAVTWSVRSLAARPRVVNAKRLVRSVLPYRPG
jgi:glycosyltransferase involved in cell wall biosynthesis